MHARTTPIPLRTAISASELATADPVDAVRAIGSYWVRNSGLDLQSRLVRYFKDSSFLHTDAGIMQGIGHAYSEMLAEFIAPWRPASIVRVLSSSEIKPDAGRPLAFLTDRLCSLLHITDCTDVFFRSEPRKPMRMINRLAGDGVLRQRISYVLQDMFVVPRTLQGPVVILDDILNLGATAGVYASALKRFCGVTEVYSANIAAARFTGGKDGWGTLHLDIDRFAALARTQVPTLRGVNPFDPTWTINGGKYFHLNQECAGSTGRAFQSMRIFSELEYTACLECSDAKHHPPR